jgi:hypothetical protein
LYVNNPSRDCSIPQTDDTKRKRYFWWKSKLKYVSDICVYNLGSSDVKNHKISHCCRLWNVDTTELPWHRPWSLK